MVTHISHPHPGGWPWKTKPGCSSSMHDGWEPVKTPLSREAMPFLAGLTIPRFRFQPGRLELDIRLCSKIDK